MGTHNVHINTPEIVRSIGSTARIDINQKLVNKLLVALDRDKWPGCDNIYPVFLIKRADSLAAPITLLFKKSSDSQVFPTIWKKANIIPIHQNRSRFSFENDRSMY